mgnify:CR=1 FL=1
MLWRENLSTRMSFVVLTNMHDKIDQQTDGNHQAHIGHSVDMEATELKSA